MSADNYYLLRKHPKGGFALVMGFASDDETPSVGEEQESFPTMEAALKEFSDGQKWEDSGEGGWPPYYCEYGLTPHPECFEETSVVTDLEDAICVNPSRIITE